ncbi:hypothetical protein [Streptomyces sp. NBC_00286]|uniref:hypothetical protein n=1 Tax=Streptomyces sp. NBC_00286 TaxID=2975701 RepID=UPI002E2A8F17|nr:hypothetical protein [Streptomyces sp. NBC_00286]
MGTSLTPEFWRLFAVLLVISMAVTFVLSAALDAPPAFGRGDPHLASLALRVQRRHIRRRPTATRMTEASRRPVRTAVRH